MRAGARYYAILSGEHPRLPLAELEAILEVEARSYNVEMHLDGLAVFNADMDNPEVITGRAGWVKEVGELLYIGDNTWEGLREATVTLLESLQDRGVEVVDVEARRFKGYGFIGESEAERAIRGQLASSGVEHSGKAGTRVRIFITEGILLAGIVISTIDTRQFYYRRPRARPFFKPGPLSPQLSRVFVNLSRLRRGGTYLDPFCGTGGFSIEACMAGAGRVVCGDIDRAMVRGSRGNLESYGCVDSLVYHGNASMLPLADESVDSISTDPPYGRSTTTAKQGYNRLVKSFISEAARVAKRGSYIVYAGPYKNRPWIYAADAGLRVVGRYHMYVHSSLTREVVVARKVY